LNLNLKFRKLELYPFELWGQPELTQDNNSSDFDKRLPASPGKVKIVAMDALNCLTRKKPRSKTLRSANFRWAADREFSDSNIVTLQRLVRRLFDSFAVS
jgi:hypothetical protein